MSGLERRKLEKRHRFEWYNTFCRLREAARKLEKIIKKVRAVNVPEAALPEETYIILVDMDNSNIVDMSCIHFSKRDNIVNKYNFLIEPRYEKHNISNVGKISNITFSDYMSLNTKSRKIAKTLASAISLDNELNSEMLEIGRRVVQLWNKLRKLMELKQILGMDIYDDAVRIIEELAHILDRVAKIYERALKNIDILMMLT